MLNESVEDVTSDLSTGCCTAVSILLSLVKSVDCCVSDGSITSLEACTGGGHFHSRLLQPVTLPWPNPAPATLTCPGNNATPLLVPKADYFEHLLSIFSLHASTTVALAS